MVQILKCVTRVWQASQVEFHGQYSAPRLLELIKYLEHSTPVHVLAVALVTPLPCLVNVISMDLIPLSPPDAGWMANWAFWLRAFGFTCISTMSNFAMHQRAMGLPSISMRKMAAVVVFISFGVALVSIGLAVTIGFPVPFLAMLTGLPWTLFFQVTIAIEWGSYIRQNPRVGADRNEFSKIVSIHGLMIVVYPVYYFVYQQLGPMAQGAFSLMLPVIKTGLKNVISKRFRILSDLRPEETVLTIEVFSALFVAFSMQNSLSFLPVVLLTTVDVVHAAVSVYDIYHIANELMETRARIQTLTPALDMRVDGTLDTRDWLAGVMHEASALLTQLDAESRDRIASTAPLRSLAALHGSNADQVATRSLVVMPRVVSVKRVTPTSANVPRDLPPRSKKRTQVVAFTLERPRSSNVASQLVREQELFVVQVLRFLHTTEFVVLVEFVEVMIPTIYLTYLSVIMQLPNRQYYSQLTNLDAAQHQRLIASVAVYAMLELSTLLLLNYVVWRRLRFSLFAQLGFVLETRWRTVQAKLVLWVLYTVQCTLEHYGADYSFQFAWLRHRSDSTR